MGNLNELHRVISKTSRDLNKEAKQKEELLINSYYSVKYKYDKANDIIELSNISSIKMCGDQVDSVRLLTSIEDPFKMSVEQFLYFAIDEDICMSFITQEKKYLCFLTNKEAFDKYLKINNLPNEGYFLLRQTVSENHCVADRALACFETVNQLLLNGNKKEAMILQEEARTHINLAGATDDKSKIRRKKLEKKRKKILYGEK